MCSLGIKSYQFINYNAIFGTGGVLCYRVEPCVQMLAIQNTCGPSCCRDGPEGDAAFASVPANHNYESNNGPGPWVVAVLNQFDDVRKYNYGAGLWDVDPCPRTNNVDPTNPRTCDPATCTAETRGGLYVGEDFGCWRCDEVARIGYVYAETTDNLDEHLELTVEDTRQRQEINSYGACFYIAKVKVFSCALSGVAPPQSFCNLGIRFYQFIDCTRRDATSCPAVCWSCRVLHARVTVTAVRYARVHD